MSYGVTDEGFVIKPEDAIQSAIETRFRAAYGDTLDLSPQSDFGQCVGVGTILMSEVWQILQDVYDSGDVNNATGLRAETLARITGTFRDVATFTQVSAYCCGTPTTSLSTDTKMSLADSHEVFQSDETSVVLIAAATAHATLTAYTAGDIRTLSSKILYCTVGGTSDSVAPTPGAVGTSVTDDSVTWLVIGEGTGYVLVDFIATSPGAIPAYAGQATRIETATSGWLSVYNMSDHTYLGTDVSTDAELFVKREQELAGSGSGTVAAVRAALLLVDGVTGAYIIENDTETTDGYGTPPKSIHAIVSGGDTADIAETIFLAKGGGTGTYGSSSDTYTDDKGEAHIVYFSRPSVIDVYIIVNITVDSDFPSDGDDQIKTLLADWGDANLDSGDSVIASVVDRQIWSISGIVDVSCLIGTSSPPVARTTITTTVVQRADIDTSRIVVNHV